MTRIFTFLLLFSAGVLQAATLLTGNVDLPTSAQYSTYKNFTPGNGDEVEFNPPVFRWPGAARFTNYWTPSEDKTCWQYRFQASYSTDFSAPVVNKLTAWTVYNFFAPFTNGNTVYWRVGYINPDDGTTNKWSATNVFHIVGSTKTWDRSMLADQTYLSNKFATHPYIGFTAANQMSVSNWLRTNASTLSAWLSISNDAKTLVTNDFWNMPMTNGIPDNTLGGFAADLGNVMLTAIMTGDEALWTADPMTRLSDMACYYATGIVGSVQWWRSDEIGSTTEVTPVLAYGYDWLHDRLSTAQRSNVLHAMELRCHSYIRGYPMQWWYAPANESNYTADPFNYASYTMPWSSASKHGADHPAQVWHTPMYCAMAGWRDSTNCQEMFELGLNYSLAIHWIYGNGGVSGSGHHYGLDPIRYLGHFPVVYGATLPEAELWRHPFLTRNIDFWMHITPSGFSEMTDATGDVSALWSKKMTQFQLLCNWMTNTHAVQYWRRNNGSETSWQYYDITLPFYFPEQAQTTNATLDLHNAVGGLVTGSSVPVNDYGSFTNGVGFAMYARPYGTDMGHSQPCDLDPQIWAYGAQVTVNGDDYNAYGHHSMSRNVVLVNGYGMQTAMYEPQREYHARFTRFTNASDFVYAAADGTYAYPVTARTIAGQQVKPQTIKAYQSGPCSNLTKMVRHVLFPRRKYFVIYDEMTARTNMTFDWSWHIPYVWRRDDTLTPKANEITNIVSSGGYCLSNSLAMQTNGNERGYTYVVGGQYVTQTTVRQAITNRVNVVVQHINNPSLLTPLVVSSNSLYTNTWTGEEFLSYRYLPRAHVVYMRSPEATNWNFMTVVYPVPIGGTAPTITRIDDYTVAVTNGSEGDIISFDTNRADVATLVVDVGATNAPPQPRWALSIGSFDDLPALVVKLRARSDPVSAYLWDRFSLDSQRVLSDSQSTARQQADTVVAELNRVLAVVSIYDAQRFAGVSLSRQARLLLQTPNASRTMELNIALLNSAYPDEIRAPNPPRMLRK